MLSLMDEYFGFKHSMILLVSEDKKYLNVLKTYGYENKGIGAKVNFGIGVIGIVAQKKKLMRMANLGMQRSYMQAIRKQVSVSDNKKLQDEVVSDLTILIGPEGDFSIQEVEVALNKNFIPVSLGSSRLRTETAGVIACHTIALHHE